MERFVPVRLPLRFPIYVYLYLLPSPTVVDWTVVGQRLTLYVVRCGTFGRSLAVRLRPGYIWCCCWLLFTRWLSLIVYSHMDTPAASPIPGYTFKPLRYARSPLLLRQPFDVYVGYYVVVDLLFVDTL